MSTTTSTIPYILTGTGITLYLDNKPYTTSRTSNNFSAVLEVLKDSTKSHDERSSTIKSLLNVKEKTKALLGTGRFTFDTETEALLLDGKPTTQFISSKVMELFHNGLDISPVLNFLNKLQENHSYRSVQCLYGFLEANNIPLTPDGDFLTFKKVRKDYKDYYTGEMDNSIGSKPELERNQVNEDPNITCSNGLHVCAEHYLNHYHGNEGRVMVCKVNPAEVVAVPHDYNNSKMRVRTYEVVSEIPESDAKKYFDAPVMSGTEYVDEEDDSDFYNDDDILDYSEAEYDPETDMEKWDIKTIDVCGFKVGLTFQGTDDENVVYMFSFTSSTTGKTVEVIERGENYTECVEAFVENHYVTVDTYLVEMLGVTYNGDVIRDCTTVERYSELPPEDTYFATHKVFREKYPDKTFELTKVVSKKVVKTTAKLV